MYNRQQAHSQPPSWLYSVVGGWAIAFKSSLNSAMKCGGAFEGCKNLAFEGGEMSKRNGVTKCD
jgi:hypothetical protein